VALAVSEVRGIVERVFARRDVLDACARRDLGAVIRVLSGHGVTQGQIAELTGISQGRLSEWVRHRRAPRASSTFEAFAEGLGVPAAAREALGLAPRPVGTAGPGVVARSFQGQAAAPAVTLPGEARPPSLRPAGTSGDGLADLRGLEPVRAEVADVLAILKAEQSRRKAGSVVRRGAWKNLVFTGGAGSGKSRAAAAVGQAYRKLGLLDTGHVLEVAAADLVGASSGETGTLVAEALKPATGGILLINGAHDWYRLRDHGRQVSRRLYAQLSEYRNELGDGIAVIVAGQADPLLRWLHGYPPLAARFQAVIGFPGYTPEQLTAIFSTLAEEAGLRLTPGAVRKAAAVLDLAAGGDGPGNARLAVGLRDLATLVTITETDIPQYLDPGQAAPDEDWSGLYL